MTNIGRMKLKTMIERIVDKVVTGDEMYVTIEERCNRDNFLTSIDVTLSSTKQKDIKQEQTTYQDRFIDEYKELNERIDKLKQFIVKYNNNELEFKPASPLYAYQEQLCAMNKYKCAMKVRANFENIILENEGD